MFTTLKQPMTKNETFKFYDTYISFLECDP